MEPDRQFLFTEIPGYEVAGVLGQTPHATAYKAFSRRDPGRPLVLKVLKPGTFAAGQAERFLRKIERLKVLQHPRALVPSGLDGWGGFRFFIEDFFDGLPLDQWARLLFPDGLPIHRILELGCAVAEILEEVHKAGIIHGGIKPSSILVKPDPFEVRLSGFITPFDVQSLSHFIYDRGFVEGTLAYTSPEQTGRINHRVDFTTDLYSLGIVLYELLAGRLPFHTDDPLDLIHAHLAEEAAPVQAHNPAIPPALGRILSKLTAKQPEKRYQNGQGLAADLRNCLAQLAATGTIEAFPLGRFDASHRVVFVSKMVGRDREASLLLGEFGRAAAGAFRSVLVSGPPGIGKTRLIQELQRSIIKRKGYFTSGKFDVYQKNIPYSSLIQALRNLVRTFLTESDERVAHWKNKILSSVETNGKVICDVIPELTALIGEVPEVPALPPAESRRRFHDVFGRFFSSLVSEEHPLTMFIDDLQWCDADSFEFLANLLVRQVEYPHLFLLGAYRDNEVDPGHALSKLIRGAKERGQPMADLRLAPLQPEHCHEMVSYILDCPLQRAGALADFLADLTEGNPLFVSESLSFLHHENLLYLDEEHSWRWDMGRIRQSDMPSSVVELFRSKVLKLPAPVVDLLEHCACMGNSLSPEELALARGTDLREVFESLKPALGMGLLMESGGQLQFIHDRVQEAVLSGIAPERRRIIHWRIGTSLLANFPEGISLGDCDDLFRIASHLNLGMDSPPDPETADLLSGINLKAGEKALGSLAMEAANEYFRRSFDLLGSEAWDAKYETCFTVVRKLAKTELMLGRYEGSERLLDLLLQHARTDLDKAEALAEQTCSLSSIGNFQNAIETANRGLAYFGKAIPTEPAAAEAQAKQRMRQLGGKHGDVCARILDMPFTNDRRSKIELAFYSELIPDLYMSGMVPQLYLSAVQSTEHSLQGGMDESVIYSFSIMGLFLGECGEFEDAFRYEDLARELSSRHPNTFGATRGMNGVVWCNMHSRSHPEEVVEYCLRSIQCGRNCGDLYNAGLSYGPLMWNLQVQGASLTAVEDAARECLTFSNKYQLRFSVGLAEAVIAGWTSPMLGRDSSIPIDERLARWREDDHIASAGSFHVLRAASHYFLGEQEDAALHLEQVNRYLHGLTDNILKRVWFAIRILNAIQLHERGSSFAALSELHSHIDPLLEQLRAWAGLGPTLRPYLALIEAELAWADGATRDARNLLMDAIAEARAQRYTLLEGQLHQRMGDLLRGEGTGASLMWFAEAAKRYDQCGARQMLRRLLDEHPECAPEEPLPEEAPAIPRDTLPPLDYEYLTRAMAAIVGETRPDRLLATLMKHVVQSSGAHSGYLVAEENGRLTVHVEHGSPEQGHVRTDLRPIEEVPDLCAPIVRYVWRTRETVLLDNASREGPFHEYPEVQKLQLRSVVCVPLTKFSGPVAILYLENRLADSVFSAGQTALAEFLGSQAIVSLEHARLLAERDQAEQRLRESKEYLDKLLDFANAPFVVCDETRRILRFNHAFEHLTGYAAEEVAGRDLSCLFPDHDREATARRISQALEAGSTDPIEVEVGRKDGETRTLLWSSSNVFSGQKGNLLAVVFQAQDVTARNRAIEDLHQSQKMEGLGRLASGVAHDMNNVLGAILSLASAEQERLSAGDALAGSLGTIINACLRGRGLVKGLLDFSRKDLKGRESVDMNGLVREVAQLLERTTLQKVRIELDLCEPLNPVAGDASSLSHALMNLCVNSLDATPEGGTITLQTRQLAQGAVQVTVRDNGKGMNPEVLRRAREPFFTTKPQGKGTGLGLSIVFGTIKAHGGDLEIASQPGEGTEAVLRLPPLIPVAGVHYEERPAPIQSPGTLRILLVDDNELIRESVSCILQFLGHQVVTAEGGPDALDRLEQGLETDLVILDMNMPGMNGAEALSRIRTFRPRVKVLIASGFCDQPVLDLIRGQEDVSSIDKPFTVEEIRRKLGEVFSARIQ